MSDFDKRPPVWSDEPPDEDPPAPFDFTDALDMIDPVGSAAAQMAGAADSLPDAGPTGFVPGLLHTALDSAEDLFGLGPPQVTGGEALAARAGLSDVPAFAVDSLDRP